MTCDQIRQRYERLRGEIADLDHRRAGLWADLILLRSFCPHPAHAPAERLGFRVCLDCGAKFAVSLRTPPARSGG